MPSPFSYTHRVSYAECTLGNHVYYARYLDWFETARGEFFRHLGATFQYWQEKDIIFPVVECRLRYRAPARYDDLVTIQLQPTLAEGVRLNFDYRAVNCRDQCLVEAETLHVCTGVDEKPKRLPAELKILLTQWMAANTNRA